MTADVIPPSEISSELSRIWDSLEGTNKMRASLFNLIFYTKKNTRASYIHAISEKVIQNFPSRVIFIMENTDPAESYLNTRVSVMTSPEEQNDIACDSIEIEVAGTHIERVPFVILPHILPDLPIYVIWGEDPCEESPLFSQLQKLASRMIFDSDSIQQLDTFAEKLLSFDSQKSFEIADLNWGRMESWRGLLASTFYSSERLEKLRNTRSLQISYNCLESQTYCHTPIQSLYLQGWLAAQLGWQLENVSKNHEKWTLSYTCQNQPIEVTLCPESFENIKPGNILSVDLETQNQDHFSFGCNLEMPHHVRMRFSTLSQCDIPLKYVFGKEESGKSLVQEICHRGTSKHFLNLLHCLSQSKEFSLS